jgi:hypothetical protein
MTVAASGARIFLQLGLSDQRELVSFCRGLRHIASRLSWSVLAVAFAPLSRSR